MNAIEGRVLPLYATRTAAAAPESPHFHDVLARIGEQRGFVKTAPRIRPAQQERSLSMAPKDLRPALQDLRPERRLRALRMRPSHNRMVPPRRISRPWACGCPQSGFRNAGPTAGVVTCDMIDKGVYVVFRTTNTATEYVPCGKAGGFWTAITYGLT